MGSTELESLPADRALALSYAPREARPGLEALLALDRALGAIVRSTREPMVGRMRLTWWADALEALDKAPPPAQPVLEALAGEVARRGVTGGTLAGMIDGWEALLDDEAVGEAAMLAHARERGGRLFDAMAQLLGAADPQVRAAGEGWAAADLAGNLSRPEAAERAGTLAAARLDEAFGARWSRAGRAVGALALLNRFELEGTAPASRIGRLLAFRLTGR